MFEIKLGRIEDVSTIDWDGHVSSVIFFSGCNLRCPWCHNPDLMKGKGNIWYKDEIVSHIKKNKLIDSVVLSGGEPTLNTVDIMNLCIELKDAGLKIRLDTNGTDSSAVRTLIKNNLIDAVAMDKKAGYNEKDLTKACGINNMNYFEEMCDTQRILYNYRDKIDVYFRTTIIPGFNDTEEFVLQAAWNLKWCKMYTLQQYNVPPNVFIDRAFRPERHLDYNKLLELANAVKREIKCPIAIFSKEKGYEVISS